MKGEKRRARRGRKGGPPAGPSTLRRDGLGQYDIAPGESRREDGSLDIVLERSMESFPASDAGGS